MASKVHLGMAEDFLDSVHDSDEKEKVEKLASWFDDIDRHARVQRDEEWCRFSDVVCELIWNRHERKKVEERLRERTLELEQACRRIAELEREERIEELREELEELKA